MSVGSLWRHLGPDLDSFRRCLIEFIREVLRVRSKKSALRK
jgi:hypothetical protein